MKIRLFTVLSLCVVASCGEPHVEHGDIAAEMVHQIAAYGGHVTLTNNLLPLPATWLIKKDDHGFECVTRGADYSALKNTLSTVFQNPGQEFRPVSGPRSCLFTASSVGVALTMIDRTNDIKINCVRGMTNLFQ